MKRKHLLIFLGVFLVSLTIQCKGPKAPEPGELTDGVVVFVKGEVSRNGQPLAVASVVAQGDQIETGDDSAVEIVFQKGIITKLGEHTMTTFDLQSSRLQLSQGWLAAVKNKNDQQLEIVTPTVVANVRGTSTFIKVENPASTYTCTCNGTVHYHGIGAAEESRTAAQHSGMRYMYKDGVIQTKKAGLEYHDNALIEELAKKINHPLDWTKPAD